MNKQEYQKLSGKEVSDEEFDRAQFVYMESSLDKKSFSKSFGNTDVELDLAESLSTLRNIHNDAVEAAKKSIKAFAGQLLPDALEDLYLALLGKQALLAAKIENGIILTDDDRMRVIAAITYRPTF